MEKVSFPKKYKKVNIVLLFAIIAQVISKRQMYNNYIRNGSGLPAAFIQENFSHKDIELNKWR